TVYPSWVSIGTQIWFVSFPDGATHPITNDLNGYGTVSLSLTGDSKTIATVQEDTTRSISAVDVGGEQARQISNGKYEGVFSLATSPDGRVIYLDPVGDGVEIWTMKADGTDKRQLTSDGSLKNRASVSPDGRYVLYSSNRSGNFSIWRVDIEGNNAKQLTQEDTFAVGPVCSRDSRWVIYQAFHDG